MKTSYLIGVALFWAVIVVLGVAGLVSYENEKLIRELTGGTTATSGTPTGVDVVVSEAIAQGATTWSREIVAAHNTLADCWMTIDSKIYNVTKYVPFHPGGTQTIENYCGADASDAFRTKGTTGGKGHSQQAYTLLGTYYVATLGETLPTTAARVPVPKATTPSTPPSAPPTTTPATPVAKPPTSSPSAPSTALNIATVATHSTSQDCWLIVSNKVYNVTAYIPFHPGGTNTIKPWCGKEATNAFTTRGGNGKHSAGAWSQLENYLVGTLGTTASAAATTPQAPTPVRNNNEDHEDEDEREDEDD